MCVSSECYLKAGFAFCWVSTKRYCQAKDPEKGIYAKAMGTCIFMQALEWRRIQHSIGTKLNRVQALVERSQEGQHRPSVLHLGGGSVPAELADLYQIGMCSP